MSEGLVVCRTLSGELRRFPREQVRFRPAAYGVALYEGRFLMARSVFTGLWEFPGGAVEPYETMLEGLKREFREETGVDPEPGGLLEVAENFVSIFGHPFHSLRFYYSVWVPPEAPLQCDESENDAVAWIDPYSLPAESFPADQLKIIRRLLPAR